MTDDPGPSAQVHRHRNDLRLLVWWPAEGTPLEVEWSRETLAVVGRVWRSEGASLYWRPGTEALRDDLQDWLFAEAMEFRARYVPDDVEQRGDDDELTTWCRVLHRVLSQCARWHFTRVMRLGLSPEETRGVVYSADSLNRPVGVGDGRGHGGAPEPLGDALGGSLRGLWPRRIEEGDPLDAVILAEELSEKVAALEMGERVSLTYGEALERLDDLAPAPGAGQCQVWGCWRPARKGRVTAGGQCAIHYAQDLASREDGPRCECGRPAVARGLCTRCYQRVAKAERAVVAEAEAIAWQASRDWLDRCSQVALWAAWDWAQHVTVGAGS